MSALVKTEVAPTGFRPVTETLPEVIERLVRALNPQKIILFGSYAYGTPTPDSDVDLLVVMETELSEIERYRMVSRLLRPRLFPLDVIVRTPREVEEALQAGSPFLSDIFSKGRVLYERKLPFRMDKESGNGLGNGAPRTAREAETGGCGWLSCATVCRKVFEGAAGCKTNSLCAYP